MAVFVLTPNQICDVELELNKLFLQDREKPGIIFAHIGHPEYLNVKGHPENTILCRAHYLDHVKAKKIAAILAGKE